MEQDIASAYAVFAAAATYATAENVTTGVAVMSQEWDSIGEKQGFTMGYGEAEYTASRGGGHASLKVLTPKGDRHESDMWWGDGVKIKKGNHPIYALGTWDQARGGQVVYKVWDHTDDGEKYPRHTSWGEVSKTHFMGVEDTIIATAVKESSVAKSARGKERHESVVGRRFTKSAMKGVAAESSVVGRFAKSAVGSREDGVKIKKGHHSLHTLGTWDQARGENVEVYRVGIGPTNNMNTVEIGSTACKALTDSLCNVESGSTDRQGEDLRDTSNTVSAGEMAQLRPVTEWGMASLSRSTQLGVKSSAGTCNMKDSLCSMEIGSIEGMREYLMDRVGSGLTDTNNNQEGGHALKSLPPGVQGGALHGATPAGGEASQGKLTSFEVLHEVEGGHALLGARPDDMGHQGASLPHHTDEGHSPTDDARAEEQFGRMNAYENAAMELYYAESARVENDKKTYRNTELPRHSALMPSKCPEDSMGGDIVEGPVVFFPTRYGSKHEVDGAKLSRVHLGQSSPGG